MSMKPTFVLVPGNFLPPDYWFEVVKLLESHSFESQVVTIVSTGSSVPLSSNKPDVLAVRTVLKHLVDAGKNIVVVTHSYSGVPACEAAKGMAQQERKEAGKLGGIVKMVFVAAWLLQEGENPPAIISKNHMDTSWAKLDSVNVSAEDPIPTLYNDIPSDVAKYWISRSSPSDLAAFGTPLEYAAWRHIPSTYLLCELDRCIPPVVQEDMLAMTKGQLKVERLRSGHLPMLSMPDKLVEVLVREADAAA